MTDILAYWSEYRDGLALVSRPADRRDIPGIPTRYANLVGEVVIELALKCEGSPFSEGFASYWDRERDLCGYIDVQGNEALPCEFHYADPFRYGRAGVRYKDEKFVITKSGNRVPCPKGYQISDWRLAESLMGVTDAAGRRGVGDLEGNIVIECRYHSISGYGDGYIVASVE